MSKDISSRHVSPRAEVKKDSAETALNDQQRESADPRKARGIGRLKIRDFGFEPHEARSANIYRQLGPQLQPAGHQERGLVDQVAQQLSRFLEGISCAPKRPWDRSEHVANGCSCVPQNDSSDAEQAYATPQVIPQLQEQIDHECEVIRGIARFNSANRKNAEAAGLYVGDPETLAMALDQISLFEDWEGSMGAESAAEILATVRQDFAQLGYIRAESKSEMLLCWPDPARRPVLVEELISPLFGEPADGSDPTRPRASLLAKKFGPDPEKAVLSSLDHRILTIDCLVAMSDVLHRYDRLGNRVTAPTPRPGNCVKSVQFSVTQIRELSRLFDELEDSWRRREVPLE